MKFFLATLLPLITLAVVAQTPGPPPAVTIHWQPITTMNDGSPIPSGMSVSYNLYGGHSPTGPWTLAANVLSASTVRYGVSVGDDCYYVTAVVGSKESLPTAPGCVTVTAPAPSTIPATPTNLVITLNVVAPAPAGTLNQATAGGP